MTKQACINLRPAKDLKFNLGERLSLSGRSSQTFPLLATEEAAL
jgi:hypothetical protein